MNELLHSLDWVLPLRSDQLTPLMRFFTLLGYEKFILFFLPLGYWAWHRGVFLRLLQKQRETLLIKCQLLALLLCLHPAKAREALDETVAFQARQTGQRTKAPEAFARDKPLLF